MIKLPEKYLENMQKLLGQEYGEFIACYENKAYKALRFNTKKARPETIQKLITEWKLTPVEWCKDGYYYEETENLRPGLSPYHEAGVFYIQEPSAMITGESIPIYVNDKVLDLCAAPGGKSTQIAAKAGLLVSNEPIAKRARILSSNIERMGFDNCIVTEAYPSELAVLLPGYFDKIIVDAPCSGEGMMRKDETAVNEWSEENVMLCSKRQKEILESAYEMLKPGGMIVYSTCTFETAENESVINEFVSLHKDMVCVSTKRLYPHREKGEGHFCSVLKSVIECKEPLKFNINDERERLSVFLKKNRIHVLRSGIEKGEVIKSKNKGDIYIPSHAEIHGINNNIESCRSYIDMHSIIDAEKYLNGEMLNLSELKEHDDLLKVNCKTGFISVCFDGYALGLGKIDESGKIKNHYPKGLRHN